eukprot:705066-Rhodomonas_salina.2
MRVLGTKANETSQVSTAACCAKMGQFSSAATYHGTLTSAVVSMSGEIALPVPGTRVGSRSTI